MIPLGRAGICWTGGKDCNLALFRALNTPGVRPVVLVCFHPPGEPQFKAHPAQLQRKQAQALGMEIEFVPVDAAKFGGSYLEAYSEGIRHLRSKFELDLLVTGDIDYVGASRSNFVSQACELADCNVACWLPLWQIDRQVLLKELVDNKFTVVFSCVKAPFFDKTWICRELDQSTINTMKLVEGLDLSGENGEYHTIVTGGPNYSTRMRLVFPTHQRSQPLNGLPGQPPDEKWWALAPHVDLIFAESPTP
mmetsp:Transcript_4950/g.7500  ORF Transcript_4950/g.7500 Transcript_4950/m.7500 type:complete len:250 (-) Transcript_4950:447-1196(-)